MGFYKNITKQDIEKTTDRFIYQLKSYMVVSNNRYTEERDSILRYNIFFPTKVLEPIYVSLKDKDIWIYLDDRRRYTRIPLKQSFFMDTLMIDEYGSLDRADINVYTENYHPTNEFYVDLSFYNGKMSDSLRFSICIDITDMRVVKTEVDVYSSLDKGVLVLVDEHVLDVDDIIYTNKC